MAATRGGQRSPIVVVVVLQLWSLNAHNGRDQSGQRREDARLVMRRLACGAALLVLLLVLFAWRLSFDRIDVRVVILAIVAASSQVDVGEVFCQSVGELLGSGRGFGGRLVALFLRSAQTTSCYELVGRCVLLLLAVVVVLADVELAGGQLEAGTSRHEKPFAETQRGLARLVRTAAIGDAVAWIRVGLERRLFLRARQIDVGKIDHGVSLRQLVVALARVGCFVLMLLGGEEWRRGARVRDEHLGRRLESATVCFTTAAVAGQLLGLFQVSQAHKLAAATLACRRHGSFSAAGAASGQIVARSRLEARLARHFAFVGSSGGVRCFFLLFFFRLSCCFCCCSLGGLGGLGGHRNARRERIEAQSLVNVVKDILGLDECCLAGGGLPCQSQDLRVPVFVVVVAEAAVDEARLAWRASDEHVTLERKVLLLLILLMADDGVGGGGAARTSKCERYERLVICLPMMMVEGAKVSIIIFMMKLVMLMMLIGARRQLEQLDAANGGEVVVEELLLLAVVKVHGERVAGDGDAALFEVMSDARAPRRRRRRRCERRGQATKCRIDVHEWLLQ